MANFCFLSIYILVAVICSSTVKAKLGFPCAELSISTDRLLDLTHPFNNETVYWVEQDKAGFSFNLTTIN